MIARYRIAHLTPAPANTFALWTCHTERRRWLASVIAIVAVEPCEDEYAGWAPYVAAVGADGLLMHESELDHEVLIVSGYSEAPDGHSWLEHFDAGSPGSRLIGLVEADFLKSTEPGRAAGEQRATDDAHEHLGAANDAPDEQQP